MWDYKDVFILIQCQILTRNWKKKKKVSQVDKKADKKIGLSNSIGKDKTSWAE